PRPLPHHAARAGGADVFPRRGQFAAAAAVLRVLLRVLADAAAGGESLGRVAGGDALARVAHRLAGGADAADASSTAARTAAAVGVVVERIDALAVAGDRVRRA